jgi:hypothetical protein
MIDRSLPKSWRTWVVAGAENELLVRETCDRATVVLEVRRAGETLAQISLGPEAWSSLGELRYYVEIAQPERTVAAPLPNLGGL